MCFFESGSCADGLSLQVGHVRPPDPRPTIHTVADAHSQPGDSKLLGAKVLLPTGLRPRAFEVPDRVIESVPTQLGGVRKDLRRRTVDYYDRSAASSVCRPHFGTRRPLVQRIEWLHGASRVETPGVEAPDRRPPPRPNRPNSPTDAKMRHPTLAGRIRRPEGAESASVPAHLQSIRTAQPTGRDRVPHPTQGPRCPDLG